MFNQTPINANPIGFSQIPLLQTQDSIAFNGYSLQNASIITSEIDFDNLTNIDLNAFKYPRDDGGSVLSKFYRGKDIALKITLKAATSNAFNTLLDDFKKNIRNTEGNLDITVNGEIRRIKATCKAIDFERKAYNVTFTTAKVVFQAVEPFFYAVNAQSYEFQAQSGSFFGEFSNNGSADSLPALYFIFGSGTSATALGITAFGKTLTITTALTNNDVVIIDSKQKSVTKNGVEIDYTGQFPKFPPGSCPFQVSITGTSLLDLTAIIPKNYL
jgi:phage-related protein